MWHSVRGEQLHPSRFPLLFRLRAGNNLLGEGECFFCYRQGALGALPGVNLPGRCERQFIAIVGQDMFSKSESGSAKGQLLYTERRFLVELAFFDQVNEMILEVVGLNDRSEQGDDGFRSILDSPLGAADGGAP